MTAPLATAQATSPSATAPDARAPRRELVDSFGRHVDCLRIGLTERCNLRCVYCVPGPGDHASPESRPCLTFAEIERFSAIAAEEGIRKLRLTDGEPLLAGDVAGLVRRLRALRGIESVALTTNGTLLAHDAERLAGAGLSRVNISLDSLDPAEYADATGGGRLEAALDGIHAALAAGLDPVKINVVVTGSPTQDLLGLASLSLSQPLHVRFIERMALGEPCGGSDATAPRPGAATRERVSTDGVSAGLGRLARMPSDERPEGWGPARVYRFPGALGTVGFISANTDGSCTRCSRLRLTADGHLRPCLLGEDEIDVAGALRSGTDAEVRSLLRAAVAAKPIAGCRDRVGGRAMSRIGG